MQYAIVVRDGAGYPQSCPKPHFYTAILGVSHVSFIILLYLPQNFFLYGIRNKTADICFYLCAGTVKEIEAFLYGLLRAAG